MNNLTIAAREMHSLRAELAAHERAAAARTDELRSQIRARAVILESAADGIDAEKVALARTVLVIRGQYERAGEDRASVIADAIKQLATGEPVRAIYGDLFRVYFGTKNYDRWQGQRSDHEYCYGPGHGSIVFSVGLTEQVRKRAEKALTEDEAEAAIYLLTNLSRVQAAERRAQDAA